MQIGLGGQLWAPKELLFVYSWSGFTVSKKARIRSFCGSNLFFRLLKIKKCCFRIQLCRFYGFLRYKGFLSMRVQFGAPRGLCTHTVAAVLMFTRVVGVTGQELSEKQVTLSSQGHPKLLRRD